MGCKVFETFGDSYSEPSARFQGLFDSLESVTSKLEPAKAEKTIKYSLLDNFPDVFTVDSQGNIIATGTMINNPTHMINIINGVVAKYFKGGTQKLLTGTAYPRNKIVVKINEAFYSDNVTAAEEVYINSIPDQIVTERLGYIADLNSRPAQAEPELTTKEKNIESQAGDVFTEIPNLKQQVAHLKNSFAAAGISISVKYDSTLPKKGTVQTFSNNTATIILNPKLMTEATHVHEFSHILIDLLGEDNPLVAQALAILKGTALHESIKAKYGEELDEKKLLAETLVAAIELKAEQRQKQGKLVTAINKFVRAIRNKFGLETNAVDALLDKLFSKRLNKAEFSESLSDDVKDSKVLDEKILEFRDLIDATKESLQEQIDKLEAIPDRSEQALIEIKHQLDKLQKPLATIKNIEYFASYVDYIARIAKYNKEEINFIKKFDLKNLSEEERLSMLNRLQILASNIQDAFGKTAADKSLLQRINRAISEELEKRKIKGKDAGQLTAMEQKLMIATSDLTNQFDFYLEAGAMMHSKLLLDYVDPDPINDKYAEYIENIKTNKRTIQLVRDDEYKKLKQNLNDKVITKEQLKEEVIKLNVKQLERKRLGVETLRNELVQAQVDKTGWAVAMTPLIYSSQVTLQLFTSMLKSKLYQASADTREIADEVAPYYRAFAETRGADLNPKTFNEPIYETYTYYKADSKTGKKSPMKIVGLIQPYDINKYHKAEYAMKKELREKYEMPAFGSDIEVYRVWRDSVRGKKYFGEVAKWYKTNTVATEEGVKKVANLQRELDNINEQLKKYAAVAKTKPVDPDLIAITEAKALDLVGQIGKLYDRVNKQYKGAAVRPNSNYVNPRYEALYSPANINSPATQYHKKLVEVYSRQQAISGKQIPVKNDWDTFSYNFPSVEAEGLERIQNSNGNVFKSSKDYLTREFTFLETDDSYGAVINANKEQRNKIVPIYFINPVDARYVSHDIGSTIILYAGMANMFKRKSEIHGAVIMMLDLVQRRAPLQSDARRLPIVSAASRKLGLSRNVQIKTGVTNDFVQLSEFVDSNYFGESEIQSAIAIGDKNLSLNKVANKLVSYTAFTSLSLNLLQAPNQFLVDTERLMEEAVAGQFFTLKNLTWSKVAYVKALVTGETITDAGKYIKESKLARFIDEFDLLGDSLGDYKDKRTGNRLLKMANLNALFFAQHMAEHETAVTRGLALADSYRGKLKDADGNVIKNEKGEDANLYDVYIQDENGKWVIDPRVANFKPMQFINLISGMYKRTNQIKSKIDDPMINRRWYGKLFLLYRKYFEPGIRRSWGHGGVGFHTDTELNTVTEGMYITFLRYMKEVIQSHGKFGSVYGLMHKDEQANVKRTSIQLLTSITSFVIGSMILNALKDDDDDGYVAPFVAYQLLRMHAELGQFYNPIDFYRFFSSPTAVSSTVLNFGALMSQLLGEDIPYHLGLTSAEGVNYEKSGPGYEKGDSKALKKAKKLFPIMHGINTTMNPDQAVKFLTQ